MLLVGSLCRAWTFLPPFGLTLNFGRNFVYLLCLYRRSTFLDFLSMLLDVLILGQNSDHGRSFSLRQECRLVLDVIKFMLDHAFLKILDRKFMVNVRVDPSLVEGSEVADFGRRRL